ncbi:MAG TPA: DinB family protein, partial [Dehalococcoidia bacterium]|nr:DinB family protein [Dehalococcoidia bacterium]
PLSLRGEGELIVRVTSTETIAGEVQWSIAEVLAHLLQQERLRAERIGVALREDGVGITPSDPEAYREGARAGRVAPVPQLIHGLLASRRQIERLLDEAEALQDGLERGVQHPLMGRQTVAWMLREKVIEHEREHVEQIEALKASQAGQNSV